MSGLEALETAVIALVHCPGEDAVNCSNCGWRSVENCRKALAGEVKNGIHEQEDFRRIMFNRCHALTKDQTCDICRYQEECFKERSV